VLVEAQGFARLIVPASPPQTGLDGALARLAESLRRLLPAPAWATT